MAVSPTHNGLRWDAANARMDYYYRGTRIGDWDANGFTVASGTVTLPAGTIGAADIADSSLLGDQVANVADVNTEGGVPLIYRIDIPAVSATNLSGATDVTVVDKIRVLDVSVLKTAGTTGGGAENVLIYNGATAITDSMSWTGADLSIVRAATINDAVHEIAAAGTLRVVINTSITDETSDAGVAIITAIKVA